MTLRCWLCGDQMVVTTEGSACWIVEGLLGHYCRECAHQLAVNGETVIRATKA